MAVNKYAAYCITFLVFGVIIIIILAFVLPYAIPRFAEELGEEISQIIPGFEPIAFTSTFLCVIPIIMIVTKRKIEKKSN